jgi:hypothetical protein
MAPSQLGRRPRLQLIDDHQLQRFDRLEILRRDFSLRNRKIKFSFDTEHQVDHVHRCQPDIHKPRFRENFRYNRILIEDCLDESKDPVLNVDVNDLPLQLHLPSRQSQSKMDCAEIGASQLLSMTPLFIEIK